MPAAATDFRVICGSFVFVFQAFMKKRALEKMKMKIRLLFLKTRTQGVLFGAVLSYLMWGSLLLLRSGDVERNPGPGPEGDGSVKKSASLKQTKINTRSSSSEKGAGSDDKRTPQRLAPQNLSLADVMAKLNERNPGPSDDQPSVKPIRLDRGSARSSSMDAASRRGGSTDAAGDFTESRETPQEPTLVDVMAILNSLASTMNSKFENVERNVEKGVRELSQQFTSMQSGFDDLRQEVNELRRENQDLVSKNCELMSKLEELGKKTDDLEGRSKGNNLIFYGIPRTPNETNEQCEGKIHDLLTDKLDCTKDIQFDRVHRLNMKANSPIIARCCFFKDKVMILKCKRKLQGSSAFIGEDFSYRVRETRRKLSVHLKKARNNGQKASMVFDHLYIDGRKFFLDSQDRLTEDR